MTLIPFPNYEPDRADWSPDASDAFKNVLPIRDGWGPLKSFSVISDDLGAPCRGAIAARKNNGEFVIFAGTAAKLKQLNTTDFTWDDRTRSSGDYSVPDGETWAFQQFKTASDNFLIAANPNDDIQVFDIEAGTNFAALGGSPFKVRFLAVVGFHLGIFSGADDPLKMALSGVSEPDFWTPFRRGSDEQVITEGGWIRGAVGDQSGAFIAMQDRWVRLSLAGRTDVSFVLDEQTPLGPGVVAPYSIVRIGPRIFYKAEEGFYVLGSPSSPIGAERVDRTIEDNQNRDFAESIQGAADVVSQNIVWRYWSADHTDGDYSDKLIGYNKQLDRWWTADLNLQHIFPAATAGTTADSTEVGDTLVDDGPFSDVLVDARMFEGGQPVLAGFDENNKLGFFSGANMAATLETADLSLTGNTARRALAQRARLMTDATDATMQVAKLDELGGTRTWSSEISKATDKSYPMRSEGRFHRYRANVASGEAWSHVSGVEPVFRPTGKR